jgi:hypothetical protein
VAHILDEEKMRHPCVFDLGFSCIRSSRRFWRLWELMSAIVDQIQAITWELILVPSSEPEDGATVCFMGQAIFYSGS